MNATRCNRFNSCNAPICPLDSNFLNRIHLRDESTCYYLREAIKKGGLTKIRGAIGVSASLKVKICLNSVLSTHSPPKFGKLAKKLGVSMRTKSRLKRTSD